MKNRFFINCVTPELLEPNWSDDNIVALVAEAKADIMKPFVVNSDNVTLNPVSECTVSDLVSDMSRDVIIVEHKAFLHPCKSKDWKIRMLYEEYSIAMLNRFVLSGVELDGVKYDFYTSSAADLKLGKSRMIRHGIKVEKSKEFFFMRNPKTLTGWSANEECKVKATLFSGSEALPHGIAVNDVCVVPSIEMKHIIKKALVMDKEGKVHWFNNYQQSVTHFDGMMIIIRRPGELLDIPEVGQGRIGCFKLTWVVLDISLLRARAKHWGKKLPRAIEDYYKTSRNFEGIRAICTEDCVKGLKWFETFEDLCEALRSMGADKLRMCRGAEESVAQKRDFSRQALQELICATDEDLRQLGSVAANKVAELNTIDGQLKYLKKSDGLRGLVFDVYPDMLANKHVYEDRKEMWLKEFNKRMVTPLVRNSHYEQIEEDPIAFIDIVLFGIAPEKAGVLHEGECHCSAEHNARVFGIRHPANLINGRVLRNNRTPWLRSLEDVAVFILPINDITLTGYWDGDVDGDEAFWSTEEHLINLMEKTIALLDPLPFVFPHDKAVKGAYPKSRTEWASEMAKLLHNGVKYNLVGRYSNLATKLLTNLTSDGDNNNWVVKASYAHAMSILCLDFVKTGSLNINIQKTADIFGREHKLMPYNQRYMKYSQGFDGETLPPSECVVDRYGRCMLEVIGTDEFAVDVSDFNYDGRMLIHGLVRNFRNAEKTKLFTELEKFASFKTKYENVATFSELMRVCFAAICKTSVNASREEVNDMFSLCRKAVVEYAKLPANSVLSADMSDKECLRWAANMAWTFYNSSYEKETKMNGVNNKVRYAMFLLDMFGDVYSENITANMINCAPSNCEEEESEDIEVPDELLVELVD